MKFADSLKENLNKLSFENLSKNLDNLNLNLNLKKIFTPNNEGKTNNIDKIANNKYGELFDKLDTFDIILFRGEGYWFSYVVEYLTWSDFSHIGLVLKSPTYISPELTGVYLLESGYETFPDAENHELKFGVQISDLAEVLDNYNGKVYYRKLNIGNPFIDILDLDFDFDEREKSLQTKIAEIYSHIKNRPYDCCAFDFLKSEMQLELGNCQDDKKFFCSALVAYIYTKLEFLPGSTEWSIIIPKHFGVNQKIEKSLVNAKFEELESIQ